MGFGQQSYFIKVLTLGRARAGLILLKALGRLPLVPAIKEP